LKHSKFSFRLCVLKVTKKCGILELGMVMHICNPSTQEAEVGGSQVQGHSGPHSEFQASPSYIAKLYLKIQTKRLGVMVYTLILTIWEDHRPVWAKSL
jgi:hypothetical protein